jgi:hypothetical protein
MTDWIVPGAAAVWMGYSSGSTMLARINSKPFLSPRFLVCARVVLEGGIVTTIRVENLRPTTEVEAAEIERLIPREKAW